MKLSIIAINYNGSESTLKLLKSLSGQTVPSQSNSADHQQRGQALSGASKDFQTIVVDNASEEADFNSLKSYCATSSVAQVKLIRNNENLGFSGGNNIGIKKALENGAEWVVLLNNDTWVGDGFVASLRAKLEGLEGVVGIPLNEGDHTAYCGKIEWFKATLRHIHNPIYAENLTRNSNYYSIGGAVAIHKNVFRKIGMLDENYFLYFEDADFSLRAQKAGLPINFLDEPKVHHQVSATTKKLGSPLLLRYHYRNSLYFNLKNGPWYIKFLIWPWSLVVVVKQILKIMIYHNFKESAAILKGIFDFYLNKMGKIK